MRCVVFWKTSADNRMATKARHVSMLKPRYQNDHEDRSSRTRAWSNNRRAIDAIGKLNASGLPDGCPCRKLNLTSS